MALALADSLLHAPQLDAHDLMTRLVCWWKEGAYSCTGLALQVQEGLKRDPHLLERFSSKLNRNGIPELGLF